MIEPATGEFLDRWTNVAGVGRGFVRLPLWQGVWEYVIRCRRFTSSGFKVPWMHREESDAELRAKMIAKLTNT